MRRNPVFPICLTLLGPFSPVTSPLLGPAAAQTTAFSLEGEGVVSTAGSEVRASVSPDGRRIVWGSTDRKGGAGGWDLWQAWRRDGRWADAEPLPLSSPANDFDPLFGADGRWLYFFSNRVGGHGGDDLYRAPVLEDGGFGAAENLGTGVNGAGDEWAPTPSADGRLLLFASDGFGGAGRHDLFVARWDGERFVEPRPVPGINTPDDDFDAAWIASGRSIVFARSANVESEPIRLWLAHCDGERYADAAPWSLPFNGEDGYTLGPTVDASRPREMLVSGAATAPRAGKLDIYRVRTPETAGRDGCMLVAASAAPASPQDASIVAVREVLSRVFEGMHEGDSAKVRSGFDEGARFALLPEAGQTAIRYVTIDGWLDAIARSQGRWRENVYDVAIRVDGEIASAWTPYTFYLDGEIRHCGVNSIELLRTTDGWKITQVSDTRRTEGCRDVPARASEHGSSTDQP